MKIKRIFYLLLCLLMIFTCFAGCKSGKDNSESSGGSDNYSDDSRFEDGEIKYDTPVTSAKLNASQLEKLQGHGLYFCITAETAQKMNIKITDNIETLVHTYTDVKELNYTVDIEASSTPKVYSIDFSNFDNGFSTWDEFDRAKLEVTVSFDGKDGDATISSIGSFSYPLLYAEKDNANANSSVAQ